MKFPTIGYQPNAPSGVQNIKYLDMRRPLAHAINSYEWLEIYKMKLTEAEEQVLKGIPTKDFPLYAPNLPDGWAEAVEIPEFQDNFVYFVYMNWFDTEKTPLLNPFFPYEKFFTPGINTNCQRRYKNLRRYIATHPDSTKDLQNFIQAMFDSGWEENQLFYEEVLAYWDTHKEEKHKTQPLVMPGREKPLPSQLVRKRFRYLRDSQPEWYQDYITTHPDIDPDSYDGRCTILLEWEEQRQTKKEKKHDTTDEHK